MTSSHRFGAPLVQLRSELARLLRHCQHDDRLGEHSALARVTAPLQRGLGVRSGLRRVLAATDEKARLGSPSIFAAGDWVRVHDAEQVRATLDGAARLRGLAFVPAQWMACGHTFRVLKPVRRLVDDAGLMRPVSRTVLLERVTCDWSGDELGCGRHCPLMFRDEWLEQAPNAPPPVPEPDGALWATVRSLAEIRGTLDRSHQREGLTFMPDMAAFAGLRLRVVRRLSRVFELDRWTPVRGPVYVLEAAHCSGAALGREGPCDRACALLWHGDWLRLSRPDRS